jgi:REP element-mobilizing transposase RayT
MWIEPNIERKIYRMIVSATRNLGCTTLAINGMPDHIHILIKQTTTSTIADIMKRAKGTSSRLINQYNLTDDHFQWGKGYGVFSVSRWDTEKIVHYIQRQKEHHQKGVLIDDLESVPLFKR